MPAGDAFQPFEKLLDSFEAKIREEGRQAGYEQGFRDCSQLASEFDGVSDHPWRLEDTLLAKTNRLAKDKMRKNTARKEWLKKLKETKS